LCVCACCAPQGSTTGQINGNLVCRGTGGMVTWQVDRGCHLISAKAFDRLCKRMRRQVCAHAHAHAHHAHHAHAHHAHVHVHACMRMQMHMHRPTTCGTTFLHTTRARPRRPRSPRTCRNRWALTWAEGHTVEESSAVLWWSTVMPRPPLGTLGALST